MSMTDYGENWLLQYVVSSGTKYLGLYLTPPGEATNGTEASGGGYARQPITFGSPANGQVVSTQLIQFPVCTAAWGTVTGFAVCDAATGGNPLWYGQLTDSAGNPTPKNVTPGDIFQVPVGDLVLTLD